MIVIFVVNVLYNIVRYLLQVDLLQEDRLVRFRKLIEAEVGPLKPLFGKQSKS